MNLNDESSMLMCAHMKNPVKIVKFVSIGQ